MAEKTLGCFPGKHGLGNLVSELATLVISTGLAESGGEKNHPTVHLVSFADSRLYASKKRFRRQARLMGIFKSVAVLSEKNLERNFVSRNITLLRPGVRGFGYWIWKPQVILQRIRKISDGELLIYCDVGFHLNPRGKQRLLNYLRELNESKASFIVFQSIPPIDFPEHDGRQLPDHRDVIWTKGDLLDSLGMRRHPRTSEPTFQAGLIVMKKNETTVSFLQEWRDFISQNPQLIDDSPSLSPNEPGFQQNRHDQSVYSLLMKKLEVDVLIKSAFEFWYPDKNSLTQCDWNAIDRGPFLAMRDKARGRPFAKHYIHRFAKFLGRVRNVFF